MPFIWSAFTSSSSSNHALKGKSKSSNDIFKNLSGNEQKRRLTRQRKLRHATDDELGLRPGVIHDRSQSWPVSPDSGQEAVTGSGSRTPHHAAAEHWSKSAVPQPLPLPEATKQSDQLHGSKRLEGSVSGLALTSFPYQQKLGKNLDSVAKKASKSPTYRRRGMQQELNVNTQQSFWLNVPVRSAPNSGYTSPVLSPQRFSTGDIFCFSCQASSGFDGISSDRLAKSNPVSPRITPSPDHSPLQSPRFQSSPGTDVNHAVNFIRSRHKSLTGSPAVWAEGNNANVHPLPLPPGVSRPSPTVHRNLDKLDTPTIKGQWQKGRLIGRGTYGSVYVATHRETGATCAMKEVELIPDDPKSAECIKQLEQEIKFLRELRHPNIVQYYGCEMIEDHLCIYLEYVHPGSINKYVREHCGAMTESVVRNFARHILSGLVYLHSTKTVHRDIKGANLLVDAAGVVKLADFGLAKHLSGRAIELSLKGTPHWMAPEVLMAAMRKDANVEVACGVDIWSVGCTVIEMLTGKPPWGELNGVQAMFNVLNRSPPIPETLSPEGKDFLRQCLQRRAEDRPSAAMLLEHPFLRSSSNLSIGGFVQEFSGIQLQDAPCSPNDWIKRNKEVMPLPSGPSTPCGKLPPNIETIPKSSPGSSESGRMSRHSPHSLLEVPPRKSSPGSSSQNISPSYVPDSMAAGTGKNGTRVFWRSHRKEIPHQ